MIELRRTVRFCINEPTGDVPDRALPSNTYSAWPPMRGLGRYYELRVTCRGEVDPVTGYFINIKQIDEAVRGGVVPYLERLLGSGPPGGGSALGSVMRAMPGLLRPNLGAAEVQAVRLDLTPFYSLEIRSREMDHLIVRQQFEFAAGHRLHVPELSDQENRRLFGKCNNPSGHGHNYRLEVAVRAPIDASGGVLPVSAVDDLVDQAVIQKIDHKNLNVDVPEFKGVNPSVENIARVIHGMLEPRIGGLGVDLEEVSVWETPKTVCTYRGARKP